MPDAVSAALVLTLAGVYLWSAIGKWRHPDSAADWAEFGVPRRLQQAWLVRLHPWGEAALAFAITLLGGFIGVLAAVVGAALMGIYLWLVTRAYLSKPNASCACFGARVRITRMTIVRNAWLTVIALGAVAALWETPTVGGALVSVASDWSSILVMLIVAISTILVMRDGASATEIEPLAARSDSVDVMPQTGDDQVALDYVRTRTPSVPVTSADGTLIDLRLLSLLKPVLLLAVSDHCGACENIVARINIYRERLPEIDVRLLISTPPDASSFTERDEPQSLHDPYGYVRRSIDEWPTPTAVLLGADGLLAGGPESGIDMIEAFIRDIDESLHSNAR